MAHEPSTASTEPAASINMEEIVTKRSAELGRLVDIFIDLYRVSSGITLTLREDDIILKLSSAYFALCYTHIKPAIDDKMNKYKMASLMELLIVKEQILVHPNPESSRDINARLGMMYAYGVIDCMIQDSTKSIFSNTNNHAVDARIDQMVEDHHLWLVTKDPNEIPIFINAQFYELMQIIQTTPVQIHGY